MANAAIFEFASELLRCLTIVADTPPMVTLLRVVAAPDLRDPMPTMMYLCESAAPRLCEENVYASVSVVLGVACKNSIVPGGSGDGLEDTELETLVEGEDEALELTDVEGLTELLGELETEELTDVLGETEEDGELETEEDADVAAAAFTEIPTCA